MELFSAFIQDEITLKDYELFLTLGVKFEHNNYTGFEAQPNIRMSWLPDDHQTLWGAISKVVRTAGRGEQDVRLRVLPQNQAPQFPVIIQGSDDFDSEEMTAYEAGYRIKFNDQLSADMATFYNDYDNLRTLDPEVLPPPELGFPFDNRMQGYSYGLEVTIRWQVHTNWRIQASYTYLNLNLDLDNDSNDTASESYEEASPENQFNIWSDWHINQEWQFGTGIRYMDDINAPGTGADSYTELDARLGWKISKAVELSIIGKNLLDSHHTEFKPDFIYTQPTDVERSFMANLKWHF